MGQEDGNEGQETRSQRFRSVQVDEGQKRPKQDRRQGCCHQKEQNVQSRKTIIDSFCIFYLYGNCSCVNYTNMEKESKSVYTLQNCRFVTP